jgi:nitric oxide reductase NorD protein
VEPEGLLIDGAQRAAVAARELWWRARPPQAHGELSLARVKRRLELVVGALYGDTPAILPSDPPPRPTWLARLLGRAPGHLSTRTAQASTDGAAVYLPRTLETVAGDETAALATYRLLAIEQVARAARGTPAAAPTDRLEHDLYALAEAVAVDGELVRDLGGIVVDLCAARARALRERPPFERLTALERRVERLIQATLSMDPATPPPGIPLAATPAESRRWAQATAERLRRTAAGYRGVAIVPLWGQLIDAPPPARNGAPVADDESPRRGPIRSAPLRQRPRMRQAADGEDDDRPGTWMIRPDEPMESVEDPMGLQRPADHDEDTAAADLADSLSELPEARVVRTPGAPREVLDSAGTAAHAPAPAEREAAGAGIVYPEWDYRLGAYRQRGAVVWSCVAPAGSGAWVEGVMARHAALVRRVRRRFDGLRPRRERVGRQDDGPDLDLSAYVAAFADWRAGHPGDDRFYAAARPARRDLALVLLVDISASTDSWVSGGLRIVDVEKESLIVLLEALDALGDRHAAVAFSGEGAGGVRMLTVKDFAEPVGMEVRRRVAALEPDGYTRTGAALRHASALLTRQPTRHRLLLMLTDGKPNDVDHYPGHYGVQDTRQAVAEARMQGLVPFCLTVDREAPGYMPSIFGRRGYALLRRQELLPAVLVEVVRRLLVS